MILVIDNYDSFVFNLSRFFQVLGEQTTVIRNNKLSLADVDQLKPRAIVLSPGPCTPDDSGICVELIQEFYQRLPILGVCLGHQAIARAFGGDIIRAEKPMHGKQSTITHHQQGIFSDLDNPLTVGRYHSLIIDAHTLPSELAVTAVADNQEIMAIEHRNYPVFGVQFHPESILTEQGYQLLSNFLQY